MEKRITCVMFELMQHSSLDLQKDALLIFDEKNYLLYPNSLRVSNLRHPQDRPRWPKYGSAMLQDGPQMAQIVHLRLGVGHPGVLLRLSTGIQTYTRCDL